MENILDRTKGLLENKRVCRVGVGPVNSTTFEAQNTWIKRSVASPHRSLQLTETQEHHGT